jgi:hypothetical protein
LILKFLITTVDGPVERLERLAAYNEKRDAYAARRSRPTQVVILEPRSD